MPDFISALLRLLSVGLISLSVKYLIGIGLYFLYNPGLQENPLTVIGISLAYVATYLILSIALWKFAEHISAFLRNGPGLPTPSINYLLMGTIFIALYSWINSVPRILSNVFLLKNFDRLASDVASLTSFLIGFILLITARLFARKMSILVTKDRSIPRETELLRSGIILLGLFAIARHLPILVQIISSDDMGPVQDYFLQDAGMEVFIGLLLVFAVPITNLLGRPIIMNPSPGQAKTE